MHSDWFKEERQLPKDEQADAKEKTKEALLHSTIFSGRLKRMLEEKVETALRDDEDFTKPNWQEAALANASRRKTLREIIQLIELK